MSRLELQTQRGEVVQCKLYRNGDATLTIQQAGDWRTAFLTAEEVDQLRQYLVVDHREPQFTAPAPVYNPDTFTMSWETAPMVPTVPNGDRT